MTLVDTSVWVNHFRSRHNELAQLLEDGLAGTHAFVIGELAAGSLKDRSETILSLQSLPQLEIASESEVHHLLETHRLWGLGLGWVDLHLLASAAISRWGILTADRVMRVAATRLKSSS
jgi:predicted nucleic acid-binding protein